MTQLISPLASPFLLKGGSTGVLLLHGFTGTPAELLPLGRILNAAGYTVLCPLLPGHGTTPDRLAGCRAEDWIQAAEAALEELRTYCSRVFCCGLSMGGCLSLLLAQKKDPSGCISLASPMAAKNRLAVLAPLLAPFVKEVKKGAGIHNGRDPEYDVCYDVMPVKGIRELNRVMKMSREALSGISCPLLCVQSKKDEAIAPQSIDIILREAGSTVRERFMLENAPHVCTLSEDLDRVAGRIIQFIQKY